MTDAIYDARHAALLALRSALCLPWCLLLTPGEFVSTLQTTEYACKTLLHEDPIWILQETEKAAKEWWDA